MQDGSKHTVEANQVLGIQQQFTSHTNVDTHLSDHEVSTNALVKNEVVKEFRDSNAKAIDRIKICSQKFVFVQICLRR